MITDSNQTLFAEMATRGFQEEMWKSTSAEGDLSYNFNNLSRRRISIPLTRSKTLSLVKKPVTP